MVRLNPGKIYGRLLPCPRVYCDINFSDARVDPPETVNTVQSEWVGGANWKMGVVSGKRNRMSGRIEGRMSKLRAMEESEDEERLPPEVGMERKQLTFERKSVSPASSLDRPTTSIERGLVSLKSKKKKLSPGRIMSSEPKNNKEKAEKVTKSGVHKSRKNKIVEESDVVNDDESVSFLDSIVKKDTTPTRTKNRRIRLNSSLRNPQSERNSGKPESSNPVSGPVTRKRKCKDKDSIFE